MAIQDSTFPLQDALLSHQLQWAHNNLNDEAVVDDGGSRNAEEDSAVVVSEEDLWWDDEELKMLLNKEAKQQRCVSIEFGLRAEAVEWMIRVVEHYGFTAATAVLATDYIDRFTSTYQCHQDKPWTVQLAAVACLSLAAKVEETKAFHLVDLQVEGAKFVFEAKTIERMELLVLSSLQWRMHPVTPFSFIDHIIRRLGLKPELQSDFLNLSSRILLSLISDSRWGWYPPSALAAATLLHVMEQLESCSTSIHYQNQLFSALISLNKEKVSECYKLIHGLNMSAENKRKHNTQVPESPKAVIDVCLLSSDTSNDSWDLIPTTTLIQQPSSSSASEQQPALKRTRHDPHLLPHHHI